jgi:hypothetical protein
MRPPRLRARGPGTEAAGQSAALASAQIRRFWDLGIGVYSKAVPALGGADALRSSQELIMPDFPEGIIPA